jgi:hypothetical protein
VIDRTTITERLRQYYHYRKRLPNAFEIARASQIDPSARTEVKITLLTPSIETPSISPFRETAGFSLQFEKLLRAVDHCCCHSVAPGIQPLDRVLRISWMRFDGMPWLRFALSICPERRSKQIVVQPSVGET